MSYIDSRHLLDRAVREASYGELQLPAGFWSTWNDAQRLKWACERYAADSPVAATPTTWKVLYGSPKRPRPAIRNLIYHVCPLKTNDLWRANASQLAKRIDVFNGHRRIAVATGDNLYPAKFAIREMERAGIVAEFMTLPNDPLLREVATFLPLLLSVARPVANEATFYAHTKGIDTACELPNATRGATLWRNAAYHHLLDRAGDCMVELETHVAAGIHKMIWADNPPYPSGLRHGNWMLAGTFFWFRNDAVFSHPRWRNIPIDRYGAEAWLAGMFAPHEAASMYQLWNPNEFPTPNPYDPAIYPDPIEDD